LSGALRQVPVRRRYPHLTGYNSKKLDGIPPGSAFYVAAILKPTRHARGDRLG
jgi:hypothetical protein